MRQRIVTKSAKATTVFGTSVFLSFSVTLWLSRHRFFVFG